MPSCQRSEGLLESADQVTPPAAAEEAAGRLLAGVVLVEAVVGEEQARAGAFGDEPPGDGAVDPTDDPADSEKSGGSRAKTSQCTIPSKPWAGTGSVRKVKRCPTSARKSFGISQEAGRSGTVSERHTFAGGCGRKAPVSMALVTARRPARHAAQRAAPARTARNGPSMHGPPGAGRGSVGSGARGQPVPR